MERPATQRLQLRAYARTTSGLSALPAGIALLPSFSSGISKSRKLSRRSDFQNFNFRISYFGIHRPLIALISSSSWIIHCTIESHLRHLFKYSRRQNTKTKKTKTKTKTAAVLSKSRPALRINLRRFLLSCSCAMERRRKTTKVYEGRWRVLRSKARNMAWPEWVWLSP